MHARLLAAVVLPSEGVALVNRMNLGGCPAVDNKSAVRRERKASANCPLGCESELMLRSAVDSLLVSAAALLARGMIAREGSSVMLSISATLRNPVSRLSSRNARII